MFASIKKSLSVVVALGAVASFAGTPPPAQTHQCMKDGAVIQKTKKECKKEGGTWEVIAKAKAELKPTEAPKAGTVAAAPAAAPAKTEVKPEAAGTPAATPAAAPAKTEVKPAPAGTPAKP